MADKTNDKADDKPKEKTADERRADIATEYETLLSQSQDEISIGKALCTKYQLEKAELDEIMAEGRKGPTKGPAQPAREGQMGTAPPRGTVQSGKEPKTD